MAQILKEVPGVKFTTARQQRKAQNARRASPRFKNDYRFNGKSYDKVKKALPPLKPLADIPVENDDLLITLPAGVKAAYAGRTIRLKPAQLAKADGCPLRILRLPEGAGHFWLVGRTVYLTKDLRLSPDDVLALVNEAENTRRLRLQKAHSLQSMTDQLGLKSRRDPLPQDVKVAVWQRDGGRCVECSSNVDLEFDHIIPLSMGGSNTTRNLQLLCATCNRRKGATLG